MVEPFDPRYGAEDRASLTCSSMETYLRCGLRWEFENVGGKKSRITVPIAIGGGVAAGAKRDGESKLILGTACSPGDVVDAAVDNYDRAVRENEIAASKLSVPTGQERVVSAARAFARVLSPKIVGVRAVEEKLRAEINDWVFLGTPDVVTEGELRDQKTGKPWSQERADTSRQLSGYTLLHRAEYGKIPRRLWIDSIGWRGGEWVVESFPTYRSQRHLDAFVELAERVLAGIRAGHFLPAPVGAWWCSKNQCPHWAYCPATAGRKEDDDEF